MDPQQNQPTASHGITMRLRIANHLGMLGVPAMCIREAGGNLGAVDLVEVAQAYLDRDMSINCRNDAHGAAIGARSPSARTPRR